jgi:hypothetical protein
MGRFGWFERIERLEWFERLGRFEWIEWNRELRQPRSWRLGQLGRLGFERLGLLRERLRRHRRRCGGLGSNAGGYGQWGYRLR